MEGASKAKLLFVACESQELKLKRSGCQAMLTVKKYVLESSHFSICCLCRSYRCINVELFGTPKYRQKVNNCKIMHLQPSHLYDADQPKINHLPRDGSCSDGYHSPTTPPRLAVRKECHFVCVCVCRTHLI